MNDYIKNYRKRNAFPISASDPKYRIDFTFDDDRREDSEEVKAVSAGTGTSFKRAAGKRKYMGDRHGHEYVFDNGFK